jgi:hypothetical protein
VSGVKRVGIAVQCTECGGPKKPRGRSAPLGTCYCDEDCTGYYKDPKPGSLWPGESEADFGYPVGPEATEEAITYFTDKTC